LGFGVCGCLWLVFEIHEGITYESSDSLAVHAGFLGGTEDVYLRSGDDLEIRFDFGQVAFGLDLISAPGSTVEVFGRDDALIDSFVVTSSFVGYQAPTLGISRVVITPPAAGLFGVNNVAFGAEFIACPADMNGDGGQDIFDVIDFVGFYNSEDDRADFTDDGQFDIFDVLAFVGAYGVACP
jgi:hypothetical protein